MLPPFNFGMPRLATSGEESITAQITPVSRIPSSVLMRLAKSTEDGAEAKSPTVVSITSLGRHLHQVLLLKLNNEGECVLKRPSIITGYLRHEKVGLRVEAEVLLLLLSKQSSDKDSKDNIPIPELLHSHLSHAFPDLPYLITAHLPGAALSTLAPAMSPENERKINESLGKHLHTLSAHHAASFGDVVRVRDGKGFKTWREAFSSRLEMVLQDAQDVLVMLPYDSIRDYLGSHGACLDAIVKPQLVLLSAAKRDVLVDEKTMQVTGLFGWSSAVWGDPLAAEMLVCSPGEGLLEGFGMPGKTEGDANVRRLL